MAVTASPFHLWLYLLFSLFSSFKIQSLFLGFCIFLLFWAKSGDVIIKIVKIGWCLSKGNWIHFIEFDWFMNVLLYQYFVLNVDLEHFNLLDLEITCTCAACENAVSFACGVVVRIWEV